MSPGDVLAGRYRLDAVLGRGGMGVVWAATNTLTDQRVALKLLAGEATETHRARLFREARAAATLDHPNVRRVSDVFDLADGTAVMVMELLDGRSLAEHLADGVPRPIVEARRILVDVAAGMAAAHAAGIIHRDLKPENVFLAAPGDVVK